MTITRVTSADETPFYFSAEDGVTLFGILTSPPVDALGIAVVILSGGGATAQATNRNRLSVHLARSLAELGFHALRFDYHGVGESSGVLAGAPPADQPFLGDVRGAVRWLRGRGIERFVLVGACFGARTALAYAPELEGLQSVLLVSPPLRDDDIDQPAPVRLALSLNMWQSIHWALRPQTLGRLADPDRRRNYVTFWKTKAEIALLDLNAATRFDRWTSRQFENALERLAEREIPLTFIYGTKDWHYRDFRDARRGRLHPILKRSPLTEVVEFDGEVHGLTRIEVQRRVATLILERMERLSSEADRDPLVILQEVIEA